MAKHLLAAFAALVAVSAPIVPAQAGDARTRLQCSASGAEDISMSARYEKRGDRRKFSVEFEAAPGGRYAEGDRLAVRVDETQVGGVRLQTLVGGDIVGDLNFDTRPQADASPFPPDWPTTVGKGTTVAFARRGVVVLSCKLR